MNSNLVVIPLIIALSLLNGCSFFSHNDSIPEKATVQNPAPLPPPPTLKLVEQKTTPESCDDICSKYTGIKKKFCAKKCDIKQKRAERKTLIAACEARKADFWLRLIHKKRDSLDIDCRGL